jgi:hypothetical protein
MTKVACPEAFPPLTGEIRERVTARLKEIAPPATPSRYGRRKAVAATSEPVETTMERHILTRYLEGDTRFRQVYGTEAAIAACEPAPEVGKQVSGKPLSEKNQAAYQAVRGRLDAKLTAATETYELAVAVWQRLNEQVIKTPR